MGKLGSSIIVDRGLPNNAAGTSYHVCARLDTFSDNLHPILTVRCIIRDIAVEKHSYAIQMKDPRISESLDLRSSTSVIA